MGRFVNKNFRSLKQWVTKQRYEGETLADGKRGGVLEGSSRSGKTVSSIDFIILLCVRYETNCTINIVKETYSEFKTTLYDDFSKRLKAFGLHSPFDHSSEVRSFKIFGNKINFLGADKLSKFHGVSCDYLFINEALPLQKSFFDQLEMRCRKFWWMDYNPSVTEHWIFDTILHRPDVGYCQSTFKDNPFISVQEKNKILSYEPWEPGSYEIRENDIFYRGEPIGKDNYPPPHPNNVQNGTADEFMWKVYGLGLRGAMEGLIFRNVEYIDSFPDMAHIFTMDFGWTCFTGETLIETDRGHVMIKDVTTNDKVLTRKGYRKVLKTLDNGIKTVETKRIGLDFGYKEISATFSHHFNANQEWKQFGKLEKGDVLCTLSPLMESDTKDTQKENIQTIFFANGKRGANTFAKDYITPFLRSLKEKYQKASIFIMSILTLLTITPIIWLLLLLVSTQKSIKHFLNTWIQIRLLRIELKMGIKRIIGKKEGPLFSKISKTRLEAVNHVHPLLPQQTHIKGFAVKSVTTGGNTLPRLIKSRQRAKDAILSLWQTNTLNKELAAKNVCVKYSSIQGLETKSQSNQRVYDLHVEGEHEYFANGILVHNCDPLALLRHAEDEYNIYVELLCYQSIDNPDDIDALMRKIGVETTVPIIADSADRFVSEKKGVVQMVMSLRHMGWNIMKVSKTKGVTFWLNSMKKKKIHVVKNGLYHFMKKEFENYRWKEINGIAINQPIDGFDHGISATRYGHMAHNQNREIETEWE